MLGVFQHVLVPNDRGEAALSFSRGDYFFAEGKLRKFIFQLARKF
jgi:hypothetical protein